jgi:hypothetical protein
MPGPGAPGAMERTSRSGSRAADIQRVKNLLYLFILNPAVAGATVPGLALAQEVMGKATATPGVGQTLPPAGPYVEELAGESACPTTGQPRPTAGFRFISPWFFAGYSPAARPPSSDLRV